MLYSIYSFPNIIFPFLGGFLMDKFGTRSLIYISSFLVTLGQAIFAFGVSISNFPLALLGRGIFGCGGENLDLAQSVIMVAWFTGKELSMAFGLNSTLSLLGSVMNDNTEPIIVAATNLDTGLWVGLLVCVASFIGAIFLNFLDKKRSTLLASSKNNEIPESERFHWKDIKEFSLLFWILQANSILVNVAVYCFRYISSGFYQERFGFDEETSGNIISITFFLTAVFCPPIGYLTDRIGKRAVFLIISAVCICMFHLSCLFTPNADKPIYPIFYLALLGLGYAIYMTVYWAAISYIVEPKLIGTALGISYTFSNLGLVVVPIFVGYLQDNTHKDHGYYWVSLLLAVLASIGIFTNLLAYYLDMKNGGMLNAADPLTAQMKFKNRLPHIEEMQDSSIN